MIFLAQDEAVTRYTKQNSSSYLIAMFPLSRQAMKWKAGCLQMYSISPSKSSIYAAVKSQIYSKMNYSLALIKP